MRPRHPRPRTSSPHHLSERPSREGRLALSLLARLAGRDVDEAALRQVTVEREEFAWLARRKIDSLLDGNPLQVQYDRLWALQRSALREAVAALSEREVDAIVFKGAEFLLRFYGSRALGVMADVDLLVRPAAREQARAVLHELGYRHGTFDYRAERLVRFTKAQTRDVEDGHYELAPLVREEPIEAPDLRTGPSGDIPITLPFERAADGWRAVVTIDVHHAVAVNIDAEPFFASADPGTCGHGLSMCATDLLWFTVSRYYSEVAAGKRSLRDFAYVVPLLRDEPIDWERVVHASSRYRLGAALYYYLAFLGEAFELEVPPEILRAVSPASTERRRDWGWQLGVLFDALEPMPRLLPDGSYAAPCES